ncbi:MAG: SMEK domain-containing protein [Bacteroidota bacterium]
MNRRKQLIDRIIQNLSILEVQLRKRGSLNLLDMHLHAESFAKVLLNKVYGYDLVNLNHVNQNMPAVDLGDYKRGIAFQITTTNSIQKIKDTVIKYRAHEIADDLPHLRIFILRSEKPKKNSIVIDGYEFDIKHHVISLTNLIRSIQDISNTDLLIEIDNWIARESKLEFDDHNDDFFNEFINSPENARELMLRTQPTLSDCREVFSDEYFELMHLYYDVCFSAILDPRANWEKFRVFDSFKITTSSYQEVQSGKHNMPGGIRDLVNDRVFRPGKYSFHTVKFYPKDSEYGSSFKTWIKINGRWVYFVKPWRAMDEIGTLKNDKSIDRMIKAMRRFGFREDPFEKDYDKEFFLRFFFKQLGQ